MNEQGAIVSGKEAILVRWVENSDELLNTKEPELHENSNRN
jgi:hypothetical protein